MFANFVVTIAMASSHWEKIPALLLQQGSDANETEYVKAMAALAVEKQAMEMAAVAALLPTPPI